MKSKFMRILALILVISSLLSMFTIFASAAEAGADGANGETEDSFELIYNRTYDEGWDIGNGMTPSEGSTSFVIDYEKLADNKYNYFWRMTSGAADEYVDLPGAARSEVGSVIEFDMMADDTVSFSNPVAVYGASEVLVNLMKIVDNGVYLMGAEESAFTMEASKWYRVQLIFDYTATGSSDTYNLTVNFVPVDGSAAADSILCEGLSATDGNGIGYVRFQTTADDAAGGSLCFDNVKYYEGANAIVDITSEMGYGSGVDTSYEKTENILGGNGSVDLTTVLSMKVGVSYAYYNKERTPILGETGAAYGAPVKVDGVVMVPLHMVLKYMGYSADVKDEGIFVTASHSTTVHIVLGKNTANVGEETVNLDAAPASVGEDGAEYVVIALTDVEKLFDGYYADYDDMGYIAVSKTADILDRSKNLSTMISIMKKFVFDSYDGDSLYADVQAYTNFEHPYLLANGEQLDALKADYDSLLAKYEEGNVEDGSKEFWKLRGYNSIVSAGENAYQIYAALDENGTYDSFNGLLPTKDIDTDYSLAQSNLNSNGYNTSGRSDITNRTQLLEDMAYAYVLTADTKYLQLAYEVAINLGAWMHWGPGNFVDCADAANDFAIYYDWTYQGYVALAASGVTRPDGTNYEVADLATILATQGVHEGYLSTQGKCDHVSGAPVIEGQAGYLYSGRKNSWATVCVGGMTIASLAVLDGNAGEEALTEAKALLGANISSLLESGLDIYAPDGSYIEGASAWNYGTNNFFRMCAALDSATGGNYGLMNCWGIDTTCYYAYSTEDNNSNYFPYHESDNGGYDTGYFFYVANYFGDATLYDARLDQINSDSKKISIIDLLYYPAAENVGNAKDLALDYYYEGTDLFSTRSSWEKDALYAAIKGGANDYSLGQIDAGSFVYHNGGNVWICDLGSENDACVGYWASATRYRYYVMKPEGNNTLSITSDISGTSYGQLLNAEAAASSWGSNEYGSYVTYNMGNALGAQVSKWERGILLTNDRKTTVIQDQVNFKGMNTVYWFAHYNVNVVDGGVSISEDGRTAYMRDYLGTNEHGDKLYKVLRLSLVSPNQSLKFQLMTTYQFVNTNGAGATYSPDAVSALGGVSENKRDSYRKLAISSGEALGFEVAVVIEMVDEATIGKQTEIGVGYEYQSMSTWEPTADMRGLEVDEGDTVERRGTPNADIHLVQSLTLIGSIKDTIYTDNVKAYFEYLSDAYYAVNMIGRDMPASYDGYVNEFDAYLAEFSAYRNEIIKLQKDQLKFVNKLMAIG